MNGEGLVEILLVDNRKDNLRAMEEALARDDYFFIKSHSGKEALQILSQGHDFAIILMNVNMPVMDGYETTRLVRQMQKFKHIPIIFITDQNDSCDILSGYRAGAADFIVEPSPPEILKTKVSVFAELFKKNRELIRNAERTKQMAEEAVKAKQQFLSNMSHEIRTPLNAIIGFTKVVLKTGLTEKQKEYIDAIKISGDALIVLINDILDLAKVEAGKMKFEQIPFKLSVSIYAMLHLFETKINEKNLELIKDYDTSIPDVIVGDPVRLHQIILNLVSNAVKFTNKGKITVSVRLINEDEKRVTIEFSVSDTGIGIAENKIGSIFDNFQQATNGTARVYGGTGLGLAIAKQLVVSQGGTIRVKSKEGEGSTFSFTLTFKKTREKVEKETEKEVRMEDNVQNVRILVAEDVVLNQLLMKTLLEDFGFKLDIASNGITAIEKLKNNKYDLVLMDLQMPEMNGFAATEYIRNEMRSQVPIIALTADVTTADVEKCRAVGMNDYLSKPIDEKLLFNKINKYLKNNIETKSETAPGKKNFAKNDSRYTNLDFLKQFTKNDPDMISEMIRVYLEETPALINDMKRAVNKHDWDALAMAAHSIIPSFATIGINQEFAAITNKIQQFAKSKSDPKSDFQKVNLTEEQVADLILKVEAVCNKAYEELQNELAVL